MTLLVAARPFDDEPANTITIRGPREAEIAAILADQLADRDWLIQTDLDPEDDDDDE